MTEEMGPHRLTARRLGEIDRATPSWEELAAESEHGAPAHVRVLLDHIAVQELELHRARAEALEDHARELEKDGWMPFARWARRSALKWGAR